MGAIGEGDGDGSWRLDGVELLSAPMLEEGETVCVAVTVGVLSALAVLDPGEARNVEVAESVEDKMPAPGTGGVRDGVALGVKGGVPLLVSE